MLLASGYLVCWHYDRLKYILPFKQPEEDNYEEKKKLSNKFPLVFFAWVFAVAASVILVNHYLYNIRPGNSFLECSNSCKNSPDPKACENFCDCIYKQGNSLNTCLDEFEKTKEGK
jgi:hypothetical protein